MVLLNLPSSSVDATKVFNVQNFGASATGKSDTSKAFLGAWKAACNSEGSATIVIPRGRYLLHPVNFEGVDCKSNNIRFEMEGTIVAPFDYDLLGGVERWIGFESVSGVTIAGHGTFDAKGASLWACKKGQNGANCPDGATVCVHYFYFSLQHVTKDSRFIEIKRA